MLNKIFGKKKHSHHSLELVHAPASYNQSGPGEKGSRALKIIHAGGHAERYYMAIPAARIMEKYPSFVLARPEVFRRPWDSVVRPEDILVPGQKYYIVPRRTVKKLRSRIRRTSMPSYSGFSSFESKSVCSGNSLKDGRSISGILVKPGLKVKVQNRHVSFYGVEKPNKKSGLGSGLVSSDKKKGNEREPGLKVEKRRRDHNDYSWEPSLGAINE